MSCQLNLPCCKIFLRTNGPQEGGEDEDEEGDGGSGMPRSAVAAMPLGEQPPLGRDRCTAFPLEPWSRSPSLGTEVPETLNQLCFIHFLRKGSFKIQPGKIQPGKIPAKGNI